MTFFETYERLATGGFCNSAPGLEYERVVNEWREAGCPADMVGFIMARANAYLVYGVGRDEAPRLESPSGPAFDDAVRRARKLCRRSGSSNG